MNPQVFIVRVDWAVAHLIRLEEQPELKLDFPRDEVPTMSVSYAPQEGLREEMVRIANHYFSTRH